MKKILPIFVLFLFFLVGCQKDNKRLNAIPPAHLFGTVTKIAEKENQVTVQLTEVSKSEKQKKGDEVVFDLSDLKVVDLAHPKRKATVSEITTELKKFKLGATVEYYFADEKLKHATFEKIIQGNIFITD